MLADSQGSYQYPDEDLCLFKHYPLDKAILLNLISRNTQGWPVELNIEVCPLLYILYTNLRLCIEFNWICRRFLTSNQVLFDDL